MTMLNLLLHLSLLHIFLEVDCAQSISRRSLFFPTTTVLQYTYGLSVPITIEGAVGGTTILLSTCFQGNYDLPKKYSDIQVHELRKRDLEENQDMTKIEFYRYAVEYLGSLNLNGEECLHRMVCEISKYPLDQKSSNNVLENIAQYLFTPSLGTGESLYSDEADNVFYSSLLRAETHGRNGEHCRRKYNLCEVSLANLFTKFFII